MSHHAVDLIRAKRDGRDLTDAQIRWFIEGYTRGRVAPEQASALLMAVVWRGMTARELDAWTDAMIRSGSRLDLSPVPLPTVDKHSTGGVGDKVSLPLCPLVAACGAAVPQLSGRGLGHTGGTLDKLEAIPGFRADLGAAEVVAQLREVGAVICAAGEDLAPADRELYALRDVTGTVESIPLIASSIMSKKIAEGTAALVLDIKVGGGAFMTDLPRARELARTMVGIGEDHGVRTAALITDMEAPLGRAVGNGLEVREALDVLAGGGPPDVVEVTLALAEEMLALAGVDADPAAALGDGRAMDRWRRMIRAQGGDPEAPLPAAPLVEEVRAEEGGVVEHVDARAVGEAAWRLGAGRAQRGHPVSPGAGVVLRAVPGETVARGRVLAELHADDEAHLQSGRAAFAAAFRVGEAVPKARPRVRERVEER
ncbi:MAG TPA: thymidine phosphorylase [Miltoncostaeaceae bacterium]|nr:thymidine phosphorylase [Miltoncostaeaceae bacterium]